MATTNVKINKSDGWVVVSATGPVFVSNDNSVAVDYCWSDTDPVDGFKAHPLHAGHGVARDFETGALRMRNNSAFHEITLAVDEA